MRFIKSTVVILLNIIVFIFMLFFTFDITEFYFNAAILLSTYCIFLWICRRNNLKPSILISSYLLCFIPAIVFDFVMFSGEDDNSLLTVWIMFVHLMPMILLSSAVSLIYFFVDKNKQPKLL